MLVLLLIPQLMGFSALPMSSMPLYSVNVNTINVQCRYLVNAKCFLQHQ